MARRLPAPGGGKKAEGRGGGNSGNSGATRAWESPSTARALTFLEARVHRVREAAQGWDERRQCPSL